MRIRVLRVEFDELLMPWEISEFRGAVIEKVGRDKTIFNNHLDDTRFKYGYPLVQYKSINNRPTIMCINDGVDEVHHFFNQKNWDLRISDRTLRLSIYKLFLKQYNVQIWESLFRYRINKWLPFNQNNYSEFNKIEGIVDKTHFLERILTGNIISFAKGIKWTVDKHITVKITNIENTHLIPVKGVKREAFDLKFISNVSLPDFIGLGKNVTRGFGIIKSLKLNDNNE
ncbi:MAG: CRISPR-associated endonuclease Cas6 [Bacteroidales bacterium]|nr:CRISPR-associated endonuclease Cas6 [Bacteroidales bacterium]